jgi:hypothetical protein
MSAELYPCSGANESARQRTKALSRLASEGLEVVLTVQDPFFALERLLEVFGINTRLGSRTEKLFASLRDTIFEWTTTVGCLVLGCSRPLFASAKWGAYPMPVSRAKKDARVLTLLKEVQGHYQISYHRSENAHWGSNVVDVRNQHAFLQIVETHNSAATT